MNEDFLDLISAFNRANVEFLLVGGYAVGVHGHPRATKDLDLWVRGTLENAKCVVAALEAFGAPLDNLVADDLATPGAGFMMGVPPRRIDLLTTVSGLEFDQAWRCRINVEVGPDVYCHVASLEDLIRNKTSAGRAQDLADVEALKQIQQLQQL